VSAPGQPTLSQYRRREQSIAMAPLEDRPERAGGETSEELLTINFGPHHPATHGVLRLWVTLQGEIKRIFTGWMFAASPGLHAVEHPIYDVWITDCKGGQAPTVADAPEAKPGARQPQQQQPSQQQPQQRRAPLDYSD